MENKSIKDHHILSYAIRGYFVNFIFSAIQYLATYIIVLQEIFSDGISGKSYGLW